MTNNKKGSKRYSPSSYDYSPYCLSKKKCEKKIFRCPKCNKPCHKALHTYDDAADALMLRVKIAYTHGHFILRKNTKIWAEHEGRNTWHYDDDDFFIRKDEPFVIQTYRLKGNRVLPQWLRDRLEKDE